MILELSTSLMRSIVNAVYSKIAKDKEPSVYLGMNPQDLYQNRAHQLSDTRVPKPLQTDVIRTSEQPLYYSPLNLLEKTLKALPNHTSLMDYNKN